MRLLAPLAVAALMLAGCTDPGQDAGASLLVDAEDALDSHREAFGASGNGRGMDMTMTMSMEFDGETMELVMTVAMDLYAGGVLAGEGAVVEASGMFEDIEGASLRMYCSPTTIWLEMRDFGDEDMELESANELGHCFPDDEADIERLVAGLADDAGVAGDVLSNAFSGAMPDFEVKDARLSGGDLIIEYEIDVNDLTMTVEATVRDGRVVAERMSFEVESVAMSMDIQYEYGARPPAPSPP